MQGLHLTADLYDCRCSTHYLTDAQLLIELCLQAVSEAHLRAVGHLLYTFTGCPGGFTASVLLAESHLCVHTWPEMGGVTMDVYVCNHSQDNSMHARQLQQRLIAHFLPSQVQVQEIERGALGRRAPSELGAQESR